MTLTQNNGTINKIMRRRPADNLLPTRGSLHDLDPTVTHNRLICYKRLVEKRPTGQVALETFRSPQAVEDDVLVLCHLFNLGFDRNSESQPWNDRAT